MCCLHVKNIHAKVKVSLLNIPSPHNYPCWVSAELNIFITSTQHASPVGVSICYGNNTMMLSQASSIADHSKYKLSDAGMEAHLVMNNPIVDVLKSK